MEIIKYDMISAIGMELFRKSNNTFLKDSLSPIMTKIFKVGNMPYVLNTDSDYYMKSGVIPNRVFYIYSDELLEKYPDKIYDIVYFNNEKCIWIYSKNAINMIGDNPVSTMNDLYSALILTLMPDIAIDKLYYDYPSFITIEYDIVKIAMILHLSKFLNETYGILDMDKCKKDITELCEDYTNESTNAFIEDILNNCNNKTFYSSREYLNSFLLLELKPDTEEEYNSDKNE